LIELKKSKTKNLQTIAAFIKQIMLLYFIKFKSLSF